MSDRGFVYILRADDANRYKIGWTKRHPHTRVGEIQTSNPSEVTLEGCIAATKELESKLHRHFDHKHIRGEWYDLERNDVRNALDRQWRDNHLQKPPPPWEQAGVETDEDWEKWADAGFPVDGWDEPVIPN